MVMEALIIIGVFLLALGIVGLVWYRIEHLRRMRRFEAQWKLIKEQSESNNPLVRRAAARQALRLIKRGPK
jgi:hypothetical protein